MSVVADTHAVVWYLSGSDRLSAPALEAMHGAAKQGRSIFVSPITVVELTYLVEKGKLGEADLTQLIDALRDPASVVQLAPLDVPIQHARFEEPEPKPSRRERRERGRP